MGQYYVIANLDKRQFLHPHAFNDGAKLCEFGLSAPGTMAALALLLADGNGRGGGDASPAPLIGTWAGDRIVVAGDYADGGKFIEGASTPDLQDVAREAFSEGYQQPERVCLYAWARAKFQDISADMHAIVKAEAA